MHWSCLLLVSTLSTASREDTHRWPFAQLQPNNPMSMEKALDLYCLGALGAKAWDADRPDPERTMTTGRRRFASSGEPGDDRGPRRLKVFALLPKGPADRAKLKLDDIVVGVNGQRFDEGCSQPIVDAIRAAETGKTPLLLDVERGDETLELKVKIKKNADRAAALSEDETREEYLKDALKFLATKQSGDGGFPETLGGRTGAVVMTCVAGLAWISGGSSLSGGTNSKNLRNAYEFVIRGLTTPDPTAGLFGGGDNWDQSTWAHAYAAVFLGELHAAKKSGKVRKELQAIATELCRRQEESGGYGHGPGGENALGYVELNILTAYVLCGLGLAQQAGCDVDASAVDRMLKYVEASGDDEGGVGYSAGDGQRGHGNIGRTAGCWLGAVGLGRSQDPWVQKMENYTRTHSTEVMGGHASLMQHIMLAGVAACALGEEEARAWFVDQERRFRLAAAPDGSIQPTPWHESLLMSSNTDVALGDVWTTASWACVLGAWPVTKNGGLDGWCGRCLE